MEELNEEIYIYDRNLNFLGVIDTYKSLRWRRKYFEAGEFELHLCESDRNVLYLKKDNIIIRNNSVEAGIIENIEINEEEENTELIITGRFLSYLLDRRIIKKQIKFKGPILKGMQTILQQMTPFKMLEIEETEIPSEEIVFQATYKNVYKRINKLSLASGIGFRIVPDIKRKKFIFQNYCGIDRTVKQKENAFYIFCEEYSNIEKANYICDSSSRCNYVLVGGQGEGENRILIEIDNTEGVEDFDIIEKFVDAKNESKEELTDEEYKELLKQKGLEIIQDVTESISFDVYASDYKKRWDLGDIATVKKERWDFEADLRIIEVEEVIEDNTKTITPVFGMPLAETYTDEDEEY